MPPLLHSTLAGMHSTFGLLLLVVAVLLELPFAWLRTNGFPPGRLPGGVKFWLSSALLLVVCTLLSIHYFSAIGLFSEVGLQVIGRPPMLGPGLKTGLVSSGLCGLWFVALLLTWKTSKTPPKTWWIPLLPAYLYLGGIAATAWFRLQHTEAFVARICG